MPSLLEIEATYKFPELTGFVDKQVKQELIDSLLEKMLQSPYHVDGTIIKVTPIEVDGYSEAKWKLEWSVYPNDEGECNYDSHLDKIHSKLDNDYCWNFYVCSVGFEVIV